MANVLPQSRAEVSVHLSDAYCLSYLGFRVTKLTCLQGHLSFHVLLSLC